MVAAHLAAVRSAIRRARLSDDEVSMLAAYLFDREPQTSIADRMQARQTTVSARIRSAVRRLALAGLTVRMPKRGSSRPAYSPGHGRRVRTIDPRKLVAFDLERHGGIVHARRIAAPGRHDGRDGTSDRSG